MLRLLLVLLLLGAGTGLAQATTVDVKGGNITVDGKAITSDGKEADPILAPDGHHVLWTHRGKASAAMSGCSQDGLPVEQVSLWRGNLDGSQPVKLLDGHASEQVENGICDFAHKAFNSDGSLLYFDSPAFATSSAVHVLDLKTGDEKFFVAGSVVAVLAACSDASHRDDVLIQQHRYFVFGGSYDWVWDYSAAGKEIGPASDGETDGGWSDACK
jgi:hypothetical protein